MKGAVAADRARALTCAGLALPLGIIVARRDDLALDTARSVGGFFSTLALAVAVGAAVAAFLVYLERSGGSLRSTSALGVVAAACWLALFGVGDSQVVDPLVMVGVASSMPTLLLAAADDRRQRPDRTPRESMARPLGWVAAGLALGALIAIVEPTRVWSDLTAIGGVLAAAGCLWRATLPDRLDPQPCAIRGVTGSGIGIALGTVVGLIWGAMARVAELLSTEWDAGVRYHLTTFAVAGVVAGGVAITLMWRNEAFPSTAALALGAGTSALLGAASDTLVGIVVGCGVAAGLGAAALVTDATDRTVELTPLAAAWGGALVLFAWPDLLDALGSPRTTLAVAALPIAILGLFALRTEEADDAAVAPGAVPTFGHGALLEVEGIEFSYGDVDVLFGVDAEVAVGEIAALVGANGAGKTTLLNTIAGISRQKAGVVRFGGVDISEFSADERVRCGLNHIGSGTAVAPDLTVAENIAAYGHTLPRSHAHQGAQRAFEVFPALAERRGQKASLLSGGERQMLALAKALVLKPRLLIIDELSLGLAPIVVSGLVPIVRRLHAEGASVLLVEQSVHVALDLADRASCMERGQIVFSGSADDLRADPGLLQAVYLEGVTAALEHRAMAINEEGRP